MRVVYLILTILFVGCAGIGITPRTSDGSSPSEAVEEVEFKNMDHNGALDVLLYGGIEKDTLDTIIRNHIKPIRLCYEQELKTQSALSGNIETHFVITASGKVSTVNIVSTTLNNAHVQKCLTDTLIDVIFPASTGGKVAESVYLFTFTPPKH